MFSIQRILVVHIVFEALACPVQNYYYRIFGSEKVLKFSTLAVEKTCIIS